MRHVLNRNRLPVTKTLTIKLFIVLCILLFTGASFTLVCCSKSPEEQNSQQSIPQQIDGMQLIWHDEFQQDGPPNSENWNYEFGFVRNRELQWYQSQNATCKDGLLIIEGRREKIQNPNYSPVSHDWRNIREHASYSSSCLITRGLQEWKAGGYYEVRAKIDVDKGAWPAIWLLGDNGSWPGNGEIDMMEFYRINDIPYILANVAWGSSTKYKAHWDGSKKKLSDFMSRDSKWTQEFHIWSMKWDTHTIRLYIDGELLNEIDLDKTINPDKTNPFIGDKKFYLLLNLAIGANGGKPMDSKFPITFEVDYVRVYQKAKFRK